MSFLKISPPIQAFVKALSRSSLMRKHVLFNLVQKIFSSITSFKSEVSLFNYSWNYNLFNIKNYSEIEYVYNIKCSKSYTTLVMHQTNNGSLSYILLHIVICFLNLIFLDRYIHSKHIKSDISLIMIVNYIYTSVCVNIFFVKSLRELNNHCYTVWVQTKEHTDTKLIVFHYFEYHYFYKIIFTILNRQTLQLNKAN